MQTDKDHTKLVQEICRLQWMHNCVRDIQRECQLMEQGMADLERIVKAAGIDPYALITPLDHGISVRFAMPPAPAQKPAARRGR